MGQMSQGFWSGEMVAMREAVKCKIQLSFVTIPDVSETFVKGENFTDQRK